MFQGHSNYRKQKKGNGRPLCRSQGVRRTNATPWRESWRGPGARRTRRSTATHGRVPGNRPVIRADRKRDGPTGVRRNLCCEARERLPQLFDPPILVSGGLSSNAAKVFDKAPVCPGHRCFFNSARLPLPTIRVPNLLPEFNRYWTTHCSLLQIGLLDSYANRTRHTPALALPTSPVYL